MTGHPVQIEVQQVASMVTAARRLLLTGKIVDLSALEGRVRGLCSAIGEMPVEQGRSLRPSLEALMGNLDRLQVDIEAQRHRLSEGQDRR